MEYKFGTNAMTENKTTNKKYDLTYVEDDNGVSKKSPIAQLLIDLEQDTTLTDKERSVHALKLANQLNIRANDFKQTRDKLQNIFNAMSIYILNEKEINIIKAKQIIFDI